MKRSNPKFPFGSRFSVARKILILIMLGCFLVFFGLIHLGEAYDPNDPLGEHPWDEMRSGANHQPPRHAIEMIILPCGHFGGWIIINPTHGNAEHVEKDRVQLHSFDKNETQYILLF